LALFASWTAALTVAIGFFIHASPQEQENDEFSMTVSELRTLDQQIPRHALEARFGFVSNYDQLTSDARARRELEQRAQRALPNFLAADERQALQASLSSYAKLAGERERILERFKSENALLRNSVDYFPQAVRGTLTTLRAPGARALVAELDTATLRFALKGDVGVERAQRDAASALRREAANLDPESARSLNQTLQHADAIAERRTGAEALLQAMLRLPVERARAEVESRYRGAYARAQRVSRLCGYLVSGFALMLLGCVGYAVRQQRRAAAKLARANEHLETAVAARTAELEAEMARRARMELELRQAQKLEAVGQLASGIAHEINTPIQYVGDSVYFLRQAFTDVMGLVQAYSGLAESPAPARDARLHEAQQLAEELDVATLRVEVPAAFERTLEGTRQVASIVRAMKTFAHTSTEKAPLDLNSAIRNTLIVARNEYKYVADVETELGHIPDVTCNAGGIRQVLLNLVINAAHAIAAAGASAENRGSIRIATARRDNDVVISIADTGVGIPEAIRERIFEPFFTTKEPGRGSGQGLAISRSIVTQHGGKLWFRSELGRGTAFFIELPIQTAEPSKAAAEFAA
jgi:signal transduction histidine kinase